MNLNSFQRQIINSDKRVIAVTAQPGSGTTLGLIFKLAQICSESKNNLCLFCTRTSAQKAHLTGTLLRLLPKAKYNEKSSILSFRYEGKKVKIKFISAEHKLQENYVTCIAIDNHISDEFIDDALIISGKIIIADRLSNLESEGSWALRNNLLLKIDNKFYWSHGVDHIQGYIEANEYINQDYKKFLYACEKDFLEDVMRVTF